MSIRVRAKQTLLTVGESKGSYRYMLSAIRYNTLSADKVIQEAALRSGLPKGAINASWGAIGEVVKAWATEGHSVAVPGLGYLQFKIRAKSVENVEDVATSLITSRRVNFTPASDIKKELQETGINIECYDKDGKLVKSVTSKDKDDVEEGEGANDDGTQNTDQNGNENQNQQTPSTEPGAGGDSGIG